jgi:hypothetical protein
LAGKLDETLRGIDEAIGGLDDAVKGVGDAVSTTRGQLSHVSHVSSGVVEGVAQAKQQVFQVAETLEKRRVQKAICAAMIAAVLLVNAVRAMLPVPVKKKNPKPKKR